MELLLGVKINIGNKALYSFLKPQLEQKGKVAQLAMQVLAKKQFSIDFIKTHLFVLYDPKSPNWLDSPLRHFLENHKCFTNEYIDFYLETLSTSSIDVITIAWTWPRHFFKNFEKINKKKVELLLNEFDGLSNEKMTSVQEKRFYKIFKLAQITKVRPNRKLIPYIWHFYKNCSEWEAQMYIGFDIDRLFAKEDFYKFLIEDLKKTKKADDFHLSVLDKYPPVSYTHLTLPTNREV